MKENNNSQVSMTGTTTSSNGTITITLAYTPAQSTATDADQAQQPTGYTEEQYRQHGIEQYNEGQTAGLGEASEEAFAEEAQNRGYILAENAMPSDDEFEEEAHNRGYYRPGEDEYELNQEGYYTIEDALSQADDWDFKEEAENRDYHTDEEYKEDIENARKHALREADEDELLDALTKLTGNGYYSEADHKEELEVVTRHALDEADDEAFAEAAAKRGFKTADQWREQANDYGWLAKQAQETLTTEQLLEALQRKTGNTYATAETWSTQAREDHGWIDGEQVGELLRKAADAAEREVRKTLDDISEQYETYLGNK